MIQRCHDTQFMNSIANQRAVRPFVDYRGSDSPMDFAPLAERCTKTGIVSISNGEDAFALFVMTGETEYQVHTFFGESCRGRKAIETGREMVEWLFERGAERIWGATPLTNRQARWFNRQVGGRAIGRDEYEVEGDVEIFEIVKH